MFDKLTVLQMARSKLDWAARRNELLAENVVNANTPGYLPRDTKPFDFKEALAQVRQPGLVATHPQHVSLPEPSPVQVMKVKTPFETSPDGNGVELEEQMAKISDTKGAYETAAELFRKNMQLLRISLGKNGL